MFFNVSIATSATFLRQDTIRCADFTIDVPWFCIRHGRRKRLQHEMPHREQFCSFDRCEPHMILASSVFHPGCSNVPVHHASPHPRVWAFLHTLGKSILLRDSTFSDQACIVVLQKRSSCQHFVAAQVSDRHDQCSNFCPRAFSNEMSESSLLQTAKQLVIVIILLQLKHLDAFQLTEAFIHFIWTSSELYRPGRVLRSVLQSTVDDRVIGRTLAAESAASANVVYRRLYVRQLVEALMVRLAVLSGSPRNHGD